MAKGGGFDSDAYSIGVPIRFSRRKNRARLCSKGIRWRHYTMLKKWVAISPSEVTFSRRMEKITSIRFSSGRRSSLAVGEELNVAELEFLDCTNETSEGVEESEFDEIPAEVKLMYAVHEGDLEEVEELLLSGALVNYKDIDHRTAMHVAACQGYKEVAELLIHHGADVDAIDKWGSTPLADAIHYKNFCVITLLEEHGANPTTAQYIKNERNVPDYVIDPQEIDFTNSSTITKEVTLATWRGIKVCVKKVDDISVDEERRAAFCDELALLQRVRHPNVVQFLGAVTQSNQKMIVTEYFPKGDLRQYLKENGQLKPRTAIKFALDIARGIGYLHEHKPEAIIHGALEPSNIFWDVSGNLKVTNFGIHKLLRTAKQDGYDDSVECQPGRYMAPELLKNEEFDTKVDAFSFALILQEMIEGHSPFNEKDEAEVAEAYTEKQRPPFRASGKLYAHGIKELIEKCWNQDPAERPTFREIIIKLDKISHHVGHKKLWKVSIQTISKNLSNGVLLFKFNHR